MKKILVCSDCIRLLKGMQIQTTSQLHLPRRLPPRWKTKDGSHPLSKRRRRIGLKRRKASNLCKWQVKTSLTLIRSWKTFRSWIPWEMHLTRRQQLRISQTISKGSWSYGDQGGLVTILSQPPLAVLQWGIIMRHNPEDDYEDDIVCRRSKSSSCESSWNWQRLFPGILSCCGHHNLAELPDHHERPDDQHTGRHHKPTLRFGRSNAVNSWLCWDCFVKWDQLSKYTPLLFCDFCCIHKNVTVISFHIISNPW